MYRQVAHAFQSILQAKRSLMISDHDKDLLERWIEGRMDEAERTAFESRFGAEPELAQVAHLRKEMDRYLKRRAQRAHFKSKLVEARKIYERSQQRRSLRVAWRRPLRWAAAVAAVALVAVWWMGRPDLMESYATYPPLSLTRRSGQVEELARRAEQLFAAKQFAQAALTLDSLRRVHPNDTLALLYEGIAWFEAAEYARAIELLEPFPPDGNWTTEAWYFAALAHLALGQKTEAQALLQRIPPQSGRYEQAQELLQKFQ